MDICLNFPFVSSYLPPAAILNWQAVTTLAEAENFSPEVKKALLGSLSCGYDSGNGKFVAFDENDQHSIGIVRQANIDLVRRCASFDRHIDSVGDQKQSELLRRRLLQNLDPEVSQLLSDVDLSIETILGHYDLIVSKYDKQETIKRTGVYGALYNSPKHRRLFVSLGNTSLKYLLLAFLPGPVSGLYGDVGYILNRILINFVFGEPGILDYTLTKIIVDAVAEAGLDVRTTFIQALQGNLNPLYDAIVNRYDMPGLGVILITGGSDFFNDTSVVRFGYHYECAVAYFEKFGYQLSPSGS